MLKTQTLSISDNLISVSQALNKVNPEYDFKTYLDSIITAMESKISTNQDIKTLMYQDIPSILVEVTLFVKYTEEDIQTLIHNTDKALVDILNIIYIMNDVGINNFYIYDVVNPNIIIKGKS